MQIQMARLLKKEGMLRVRLQQAIAKVYLFCRGEGRGGEGSDERLTCLKRFDADVEDYWKIKGKKTPGRKSFCDSDYRQSGYYG